MNLLRGGYLLSAMRHKLVVVAFFVVLPANTFLESLEEEPSKENSYFHFLVGELESLDNNEEKALKQYQQALVTDLTSSILLLKQAEKWMNLGNFIEAKNILASLQEREANNPQFHILRARLSSQEMDIAQSTEALDQAITLYLQEKNVMKARETVLTKVALLADFKKYEESVETLEKYLKEQPRDAIGYYFLGKVHSLFQKGTEAKKAYRTALKHRPGFVIAAKALALQLELEGAIAEALEVYQETLTLNGNDEEVLHKLINLSLLKEDYSAALDYLKQQLSIHSEDVQSQMRAALIHFKLKQFQESEQLFKGMLENKEIAHDKIYFYLAAIQQEKELNEEALQTYLKISPQSDYFVEARFEITYLLNTRLKKPGVAVQHLKEAIALKSNHPELHITLASQYEQLNQLEDSIRVLSQASQQFKGHEKILLLLGTYLDRFGQMEEGIKVMRSVLEMNPNNVHALNHIGYHFVERKTNLEEAEVLLKKAIQNAPTNGLVLDSLGWLYFQKAQYENAKNILEKANQLTTNEPVILEHLADAYQKLGKLKEALALYRQIMKLSEQLNENKGRSQIEITETKNVQERVRNKLALLSASSSQ